MEVKVENTLKIINEDGDTFAKRAEMYYRKRPELVNFVEDVFRSYRALAERYDHLSKDLQSANRTIATVFPERVQYAIDDDEENVNNQTSTSNDLNKSNDSKQNIPKVPKMMKDFRSSSTLLSRKGYLRRIASTSKAISTPTSGLTKDEALKEIDKLQKGMLAMQTEKEFVRSVYEHGYQKYWDIENQITDMHKKVCSLQDEFGIGTVFDDNEARTLMAATALKSCQETLFKLELTCKSLTVSEFAERIDELVSLVVALETSAASLTALVTRLRSEVDDLHERIRSLEENRETLKESSDYMNKQLQEFKDKMYLVKSLNKDVEDKTNNLQTQFTEAQGNIDHLCGKLQDVTVDEEVENILLFNVRTVADEKSESELEEKTDMQEEEEEEEKQDLSETVGSNHDMESREWDLEKEEGGPPNWRQLFHKGLEDREKVLLEEYTSILQDYKEVKKRLNEVENKNKDNIFELAMQIRDLKHDIAAKDEEIKRLQQKINYPEPYPDESPYPCLTEYKYATQENITQAGTPAYSDMMIQTGNLDQESISELGKKKKVFRSHSVVLTFEDKFRWDIDELLEENLEFWLRFSTSIHQIQKFQNSIGDLQSELTKVKDKKKNEEGSSKLSLQSDIRPIYRHMREIQTELDLWLEHNSVLKEELQNRFSSLCNMQEEISKMSSSSEKGELSEYQAAKFQGEVRNMKQENNKVIEELQVGVNRVRRLKADLEKTLVKLDDEFGISTSTNNSPARSTSSRIRIPLRSFLFGIKLKKQKRSIFSCTNPTLQKQNSDLNWL